MKWTEIEFKANVGREPIQDDLERCNCDRAGKLGHHGCGICEHNLPVFECRECFVKEEKDLKRV